jgi:hypothetical protein
MSPAPKRHHSAVRAPQRWCVRVAGQVEAVALGQLGWSVCCPHRFLNVARRLLDHSLIHPSARQTGSRKFAPSTCGWHHADAGQASSEEETV